MQLPLDVTRIIFLAISEGAEALIDRESGNPRLDKDGQPLSLVRLVAIADGLGEVIAVRIAGTPPKGLTPGTPVRCVGLTASPWTMGDRAGVTYRAERIEPVAQPAQKAS